MAIEETTLHPAPKDLKDLFVEPSTLAPNQQMVQPSEDDDEEIEDYNQEDRKESLLDRINKKRGWFSFASLLIIGTTVLVMPAVVCTN